MFRILHIVLSLYIINICCDEKGKEFTPAMKNNLKAWCVSETGGNKGNPAFEATQKCCKDELGVCFELHDVKINLKPIVYCLVKSNLKENAEKVKECCVSKKRRWKKHSGQDGNSIPLNGTNKYVDCTPLGEG